MQDITSKIFKAFFWFFFIIILILILLQILKKIFLSFGGYLIFILVGIISYLLWRLYRFISEERLKQWRRENLYRRKGRERAEVDSNLHQEEDSDE